jgi:predicted DCC family thiol-disulfide oxidoreductase YuxK
MDLLKLSFINPILFFDGVCNLCQSSVQFIITRDGIGQFKFASLQSNLFKDNFPELVPKNEVWESLVLLENGRIYSKSTAALRVAKRLPFPYPLFYFLMILPRFLRDAMYQYIAKNRYRWFGKKDACWLPTPDLKARFLA